MEGSEITQNLPLSFWNQHPNSIINLSGYLNVNPSAIGIEFMGICLKNSTNLQIGSSTASSNDFEYNTSSSDGYCHIGAINSLAVIENNVFNCEGQLAIGANNSALRVGSSAATARNFINRGNVMFWNSSAHIENNEFNGVASNHPQRSAIFENSVPTTPLGGSPGVFIFDNYMENFAFSVTQNIP
ncbi:MAG: hypothetical protein P5700_25955, partial [Arthrospira platensis PCC 7345]|nr:hypothetical protein [Arthrospira platensis PCC 7345]